MREAAQWENTSPQFGAVARTRYSCVRVGAAKSPQVRLSLAPLAQNAVYPAREGSASVEVVGKVAIEAGVGILGKRKYDITRFMSQLQSSSSKSAPQNLRIPEVTPFSADLQPQNNDNSPSLSCASPLSDCTFHAPAGGDSPAACRICLETGNAEDLISPCDCSGSLEWVHQSCLKLWLLKCENDTRDLTICELCKHQFSMNFYYSVVFDPCAKGTDRKSVWIPFVLFAILVLGVGTILCVAAQRGEEGDTVVVVLSVLLSFAGILCVVMGIYLAKELWVVRTIEDWEIETLPRQTNVI